MGGSGKHRHTGLWGYPILLALAGYGEESWRSRRDVDSVAGVVLKFFDKTGVRIR